MTFGLEPGGRTTISPEVVATVAHWAAMRVPGVYHLGRPRFTRWLDLWKTNPGVTAQVGLVETAIDVTLTVRHGFHVVKTAMAVRRAIIDAVEQNLGCQVAQIDVEVVDLHLPQDVSRLPENNPVPEP